MRTATSPKIIVTTVRLPQDVRDWLRQRADYFGGSPNTELVRCVRTAMEREVGKDRAAGTAAVE
jgi:hypothetical protein